MTSGTCVAFGVTARFLGGPVPEELQSVLAPSPSTAVTTIQIDPDRLSADWRCATPERTREIRHGDTVFLTVDHDEGAGYLLQAPGIGAALVASNGERVVCAPAGSPAAWTALLTGQILPLVATVRGMEVLHASGVVVGEGAFLLAGPQGSGKSSLAAHLVAAGAELLSDDVIAVDQQLRAHPGTRVLKVRTPDQATIVAGHNGRLRAEPPVDERSRYRVESAAVGSFPVRGLYLIERGTSDGGIHPEPAPDPFSLLGLTFSLSVRTPDRLRRHLDLCAAIARSVPVNRLRITAELNPTDSASQLCSHMTRLTR